MEQFTVKPAFGLYHPLFFIGGHPIYFTNQAFLMILVVVLSALFLTLAVKPGRLVPTRGQSMAEMSYEFVANMIHSATGEDGLKFFPFIFSLFIFVLCSNFFGMIPGSFTVTGQIEVTFFLTRPVSLSVRLFANMLAGHTMLAVFAGFVVSLGAAGGIFMGIAIAPMLLIVAIMLLELLVAFLQAYVFAILTCIYLNEALHLHDNH